MDAVLHRHEIAIREDSASFGLNLILSVSPIVNHGGDVQESLSAKQLISRFKDDLAADPAFLQNLLKQHLLDNYHRLTTIMLPDEDYEASQKVAEEQRLRKAVGNMTPEEKEMVIKSGMRSPFQYFAYTLRFTHAPPYFTSSPFSTFLYASSPSSSLFLNFLDFSSSQRPTIRCLLFLSCPYLSLFSPSPPELPVFCPLINGGFCYHRVF